jgi:hypothetical protein
LVALGIKPRTSGLAERRRKYTCIIKGLSFKYNSLHAATMEELVLLKHGKVEMTV